MSPYSGDSEGNQSCEDGFNKSIMRSMPSWWNGQRIIIYIPPQLEMLLDGSRQRMWRTPHISRTKNKIARRIVGRLTEVRTVGQDKDLSER